MISIVIVGYNSEKYLDECFSSILNSSYKEYEILFIDNNSKDNSLKLIRDKFPEVQVIKNEKNTGFAGGNNIGIKRAIGDNSDFVFLLNPDTIIENDCLEILINKADQKTVLQPLILLYKDGEKTNLINTSGNYLNFLGTSYCDNYKKNISIAKEINIPVASGAAAFIPTNILKTVDAFDENFFMYQEDVDLFWRIRLAGFNIKVIPKAKIWHKYSFSRNTDKFYYIERNRLLFLNKNFSTRFIILIFPALILNELLMIVYSVIGGWSKKKIKSYADYYKIKNTFEKKPMVNSNKEERKLIRESLIGWKLEFTDSLLPTRIFIKLYSYLLWVYWSIIKIFI